MSGSDPIDYELGGKPGDAAGSDAVSGDTVAAAVADGAGMAFAGAAASGLLVDYADLGAMLVASGDAGSDPIRFSDWDPAASAGGSVTAATGFGSALDGASGLMLAEFAPSHIAGGAMQFESDPAAGSALPGDSAPLLVIFDSTV